MSTKMNTSTEMENIMTMLQEIKHLLENQSAPSSKEQKVKRERKPRDPDAPPPKENPWIAFTKVVRETLKEAGKPAGKECQQFASYLKNEFPDAYSMEAAEILAAHESWTPPPAKPKEEKEESGKSETEAKPKPKRTLTQEQKDKMAAGRKAAAERKKAEKAAQAAIAAEDIVSAQFALDRAKKIIDTNRIPY